MTTYYLCEGSVRGWCGHRHRSEQAAIRCLRADQRGCKRVGGYSDRRIVDTDGEVYDVVELMGVNGPWILERIPEIDEEELQR